MNGHVLSTDDGHGSVAPHAILQTGRTACAIVIG